MPVHYFDTSALAKHYHAEVGTARVDLLLADPHARNLIARLTVVEMLSVFARKVRTGAIAAATFQILRRRFLTEITNRQVGVARLTGLHLQEAERLIRQHAMTNSLLTLDAIQLAIALDLRARALLDMFVCADRRLLAVAALEGLPLLDPEEP